MSFMFSYDLTCVLKTTKSLLLNIHKNKTSEPEVRRNQKSETSSRPQQEFNGVFLLPIISKVKYYESSIIPHLLKKCEKEQAELCEKKIEAKF